MSPMESFIDEQCLHFEENFANLEGFLEAKLDDFDQLNEKFNEKLQASSFESQRSTETDISNFRICKKCGHDILRL